MNGEDAILRAGEPWTEHYRGTRYHFNRKGDLWWRVPATFGKVLATSGHKEIVEKLLKVRPEGGSFRITETGAVITKNEEDTEDWEPLYVCEYVDSLEFAEVDVRGGGGLQPFDLWPAFYDGARYTFARGGLWWRNPHEGLRQRTNEGLPPEIAERFRQVKPFGGSVRFTEHGKVLTLIPPQPMPQHLQPQYEALTDAEKRLIQVKVAGTDMLPIYLGDYLGGFTLQPPQRLSDPLTENEEAEMVGFLKLYGDSVHGDEDPLYFVDDRPEDL